MVENRPLSVLHIDTERGWRGGQRQVLLLADGLRLRGHRSIVAARPGEPLARRLAQLGVEVVPCEPLWEYDLVAARRLRSFVERENIEVVHAHSGHAHALGALAVRGAHGARFVVTRRVDFKPNRNPITAWKYARADALIAISEAVAESLVAGGARRDRVHLVPSGIALPPWAERSREGAKAYGIPDAAALVVMAAALVPHKDPLTFIRAVARARAMVPALRVLLVGDGELRTEIEAEVQRLGLGDVVRLTGIVPDAGPLLGAADAVVLTSRKEGLGTVVLDAMARGVPVVATRAGGIPEMVDDGVNGFLVPAGDDALLAERLALLLTHPEIAARMSEQARRRAADFSIDRTIAGTERVYRIVLGVGDRRGAVATGARGRQAQ